MPKCVKKIRHAQNTISDYFGSRSRTSPNTEYADKHNVSIPLAFKNKKRFTSEFDDNNNNNDPGCQIKRSKAPFIEQKEQSEATSSIIDGNVCTAILKKLRGFCKEDYVDHSGIQTDNETSEKQKKDEKEQNEGFSLSQFAKPGKKTSEETCFPLESASPSRRPKCVYTPLEQQVMDLKQRHPDVMLAIECGYKYRFFGQDAENAAGILSISCYSDHNFMTCCIPTHRLFVHVRRLVAHGYKVGVVKQTETSAIKASGANRNALFTRELSALYTKSTLVGEDVNPVCTLEGKQENCDDIGMDPPHSFLLCITETWDKRQKQLTVGLVAVQPSTGDVLLDSFCDGSSRSELETRVLKINPVEILVPSDLSELTLKLLHSITTASTHADDRARLETRDSALFEFTTALDTVTKFFSQNQDKDSLALSSVAAFENPVICCLGPLIQYLKEFNLERVLRSESSFHRLPSKSECMTLGAATLRNLEILKNQTDGALRGSLLWVLDHTRTAFGRRLMRKWVSQPLTDQQCITDRLDAVQEALESDSVTLTSLKSLLWHLPDIEKGLCSIYHRKCSTQEFFLVTSALSNLGFRLEALLPAIQSEVRSPLLRSLLLDTPVLLVPAHNVIKVLSESAARSGNKTELFSDLSDFPLLQKRKEEIQFSLDMIQNHLREVRTVLKNPSLCYRTVSGQEFLIEVKQTQLSIVPRDWTIVSSTKTIVRYHSPFLVEHYKKLQQLREQLQLDCQREWIQFLEAFGEHYHTIKRAVSHLATMDCVFSLAEVAKQGNYCRPEVNSNEQQIMIRDGRHPIIELLMGEQNQYVPNDTELQSDGRRVMIITGPNMGGKSSYIRQVALICIMAQIGSYVPASEARLGLLDGIYTRMGALDNIYSGRSTFMQELSEASDIIFNATQRSMVILDELGRGTSTHDGMAIAYATLEYFITQVKSFTLFVTHYLLLSELERLHPRHVFNCHMSFLLNEPEPASMDDVQVHQFITFLYQLTGGAAERSYGLNVARLADIPPVILHRAAHKASELENMVHNKREKTKLLADLWKISDKAALMEWRLLNRFTAEELNTNVKVSS